MWGGDDWRDIRWSGGFGLGFEEVIADRTVHHTLPMFLHEYLSARDGGDTTRHENGKNKATNCISIVNITDTEKGGGEDMVGLATHTHTHYGCQLQ